MGESRPRDVSQRHDCPGDVGHRSRVTDRVRAAVWGWRAIRYHRGKYHRGIYYPASPACPTLAAFPPEPIYHVWLRPPLRRRRRHCDYPYPCRGCRRQGQLRSPWYAYSPCLRDAWYLKLLRCANGDGPCGPCSFLQVGFYSLSPTTVYCA